jgi:acyl-CoA synthetase (AMP-forming)/AMP-acid ligase II
MPPVTDGAESNWNLATMWEVNADTLGDEVALVHEPAREDPSPPIVRTWAEFDDRAARLAGVFEEAGVGPDSKVALLLYNGPEYIESTFAAFKTRAVPVNVNYRYTESELRYLLENSDAEVVVADADLVDRVQAIAAELPRLREILIVGEAPDSYEERLAAATPAPRRTDRSTADLWFLYTGGTTGIPKGVMWPQGNLFATSAPTYKAAGEELPGDPGDQAAAVARIRAGGQAPVLLPAAPLMHGTSAISSWGVLNAGGTVVTVGDRSLDPAHLLQTVESRRVTNLTIVGDAFALPLLAELDDAVAAGTPYELSSLRIIVSSGVMWSQPVKDALLAHLDVALADLVGSSEGVGAANSVSKRGRSAGTARFRLGRHAAVFTEDGRRVEPGSGERGLIAIGGPIPVGYYKDPDKTAATFRTFGGQIWSVPGDWATVEEDGTIRLLGRGSVCINTGGEKVFPEEVEEVLKEHPDVRDANVVGVPDPRWGEAVTAVVSLVDGSTVEAADLVAHCRATLAGYKCPKRVIIVDEVLRSPNGKADYRWARTVAQSGS